MFSALSQMFPAQRYNRKKIVASNKFMNKSVLKTGIIGAVITALCCLTPILVILLGTLGLSALVGYLDYVLFPLLAIFLLIIVLSLLKKRKTT